MINKTSQIETAVRLLQEGLPVAFPTETVYGLGANALSDSAVANIYKLKNRPQFNPLITHVADAKQAFSYVEYDERAEKLMARFWPGPLTIILPRRFDCRLSLLASAGLDNIALRAPDHKIAQRLLKEAALPIAAPSANRSGRISPTKAAHVVDEFGEGAVFIIEGDDCRVGIESTVIDLSTAGKAIILRHGSIVKSMLEDVLNSPVLALNETEYAEGNEQIKSPGMMLSHYAPQKDLRINAVDLHAGEALLAFGEIPVAMRREDSPVANLSPSGDLTEAAANLFSMLRELDKSNAPRIAAMKIPLQGLGLAINDRLSRAAR